LNGLTEQVQTFAVGTSGTDFAISSASGIHNFNLPTASASNRGALSSADWSAFNAKVSSFASATDGTASSGTSNTISISVLIPANTFALDDVIRINHRVRATGVLGIRETRVYANTSASLTGAILISTASLTSTTLAANMQRFLAIKNASTNTEVVTATTNQLTDYASFTTAVSTLLINWTVDQYIIFAVNALNGGDSIRATMYSIEKL
jgi:prolyl oligopeptidase PreP (S9A serine peptidase family)